MAKALDKSQVNHLRRLLGWVRCEVGQTTDEMVDTYRRIAPYLEDTPSAAAQARITADFRKSQNIPKYVRDAIKALEPVVREAAGEIVDADPVVERKLRYGRKQLYSRTRKMLRG
jgi:hypothetical protein